MPNADWHGTESRAGEAPGVCGPRGLGVGGGRTAYGLLQEACAGSSTLKTIR